MVGPAPSRPRRFRSAKSALVTSGIYFSRMVGLLPPAVRRRSFRFGSVPAVSAPALPFPFAKPQAEALHLNIQPFFAFE
jgi:hypothetical protein